MSDAVAASPSAATNWRWWLALAASLLLHTLALSRPGWQLPSLDDLLSPNTEGHIDARLALPPAPAVPPPTVAAAPVPPPAKKNPPRQQRPTAVPLAPTFSPTGSAVPLAMPVEAVAPVAAAPAAPPPPVAKPLASVPLPKRVRIRFAIVRGEQGLVVGRSEHFLKLDGNAYTLRAVAETTGIAALFRPATVTQFSEGDLLPEGLRPRVFRVERGGANGTPGTPGDTANFDWAAGRVSMNPGPRDLPVEAGMQDMLSMFYQIGLLPPGAVGAETLALTVATGKKIERYVFARVGEEKLSTPLGEKAALHIKTVGTSGDATEIWIGIERRLPLRIRHVDRKGEIFDQLVDEMEIE